MNKPICFKIRGGVEREDGSRGSTHIGKMAGKGYLGSEDKSFTCLSTNDQYLFAGQGEGSYTYPFCKPPMQQRKLKYLSLFSGIEAASVAWKDIGWEPVGFAEIEPFPSAVLKHRFPNTPNYGDITKWKEWGLVPGTVDVVCAGSPCQAFSTAGLRKGLDDPRGNLALVTLGLVEFLKPKWFIWENVPGVLNAQQGSAFGAILTALGDIGYGWSYRVLDAQHFGVAQRRRRVWLCGYRDPVTGTGDWRPPSAVLSFPESLCWNPAKSGKKGKANPSFSTGCIDESGNQRVAGSICADSHPGSYTGQDAYTGRLIPLTKPKEDTRPIVIDRAAFNQGENAQYNPHIAHTETMDTIIAKGPHAVSIPINTMTLGGRPDEANNVRMGIGIGQPGDPQYTITSAHPHAVANDMAVRRLTPRETERLQGFPDDWTLIPWKGKPASECPDGPRYKAVGNSWAVPCARYIGERINMVEEIKDEISKA